MNTLLLILLSPAALAAPAVADLQPDEGAETADFVVETTPEAVPPLPELQMDETLIKGSVPSGPRVRAYGGRIELEAAMGADGVSAAHSDLVFAQSAGGELSTGSSGMLTRGDTTVTGWVGMSDGETRLARRQPTGKGSVCATRSGENAAERDLALRLTRPPPSGEALPTETWESRPSFVMGADTEGLTQVYASLQPGDQITVVQISGGPRFVEEVELTRTGRSLRWRRDRKGESVCYEVPPSE